ncbi:hypothetical protein [Dyella amyloliquefaciens]|uniref:hypothetical protein n=1 Tax=Dyella amyloliquefaciens TaxID=1770545 RepID=UPI00102EC21C|nr:hypothetical protein [Dyella amyloliquefaciens]
MSSSRIVLPVFVICTVLVSGTALADDHPMLDYFSVSGGLFANSFSGGLRADGNVRDSGTTLNFSRDLGEGGTRYLPYLNVTWRPWDRHEFEFDYYHDSTDHSRTLNRSLDFNNQTLVLGTALNSKFSLDAYGLTYRYWAWIGDNSAFGISGGLQAYSFSLKLKGTVSASGASGATSATREAEGKASTDLPDPSIGLSYRYQMAPWARFVTDAGAFKANIDQIDATLYNFRVGVEFYPLENWAIITQYQYNKIDADVEQNRFRGNATFRFSGGQVLVKYRF